MLDIGGDGHQFWILDLRAPGGRHERVGIHFDPAMPGKLEMRGLDKTVESIDREDFGRSLGLHIPDHFAEGVTEMALYRAEERAPLDEEVGQNREPDALDDENIRIVDDDALQSGDPIAKKDVPLSEDDDFSSVYEELFGPVDEPGDEKFPDVVVVADIGKKYVQHGPEIFARWAWEASVKLGAARYHVDKDTTALGGSERQTLKNDIQVLIREFDGLLGTAQETAISGYRDTQIDLLSGSMGDAVFMELEGLEFVDAQLDYLLENPVTNETLRSAFREELTASVATLLKERRGDGKSIYSEETRQLVRDHVSTTVDKFLQNQEVKEDQREIALGNISNRMDDALAQAREKFSSHAMP